jgi:hypothetical protein
MGGSIILSLLVNAMMAGLLLVTIIYCWRLNNRIRVLQDSKSELARIIREFNESTERATQSIAEIHQATSRLSENIQHKIDKANYLATDLDMMIEKGSRLAGKPIEPARTAPSRAAEPVVSRSPRAESALEQAQGNVSGVTPLAEVEPAGRRKRPRSRAELEQRSVIQTKNDGR